MDFPLDIVVQVEGYRLPLGFVILGIVCSLCKKFVQRYVFLLKYANKSHPIFKLDGF